MLIFGQNSCILGPTIFDIPQPKCNVAEMTLTHIHTNNRMTRSLTETDEVLLYCSSRLSTKSQLGHNVMNEMVL